MLCILRGDRACLPYHNRPPHRFSGNYIKDGMRIRDENLNCPGSIGVSKLTGLGQRAQG